jgi:hypothetical protein
MAAPEKRSCEIQMLPVRIWAAHPTFEKRTVRYPTRPNFGRYRLRPAPPEIQISIDCRPWAAGSGTADFPTPHGVRNSKRERSVCFRREKWPKRESGFRPTCGRYRPAQQNPIIEQSGNAVRGGLRPRKEAPTKDWHISNRICR